MDRLVAKTGGVRSEATIQSDVRLLLLDAELGLSDVQLETQVGAEHRRIDVEVGCTVIEVKKSLASLTAVAAAIKQLNHYVVSRQEEMGQRYVGIITDGALWIAFHEVDGSLAEATRHSAAIGESGAAALLRWLEGVLATKTAVRPTPYEIHERLGADSSSHALDYATLAALYQDHRDEPTVLLKRELWANLLRSALGTQFADNDELFLEHTLLVNSAEIIAHLVLGVDVAKLSPTTLLTGDQFIAAGLFGVVDRDFFDWVLEVPGGDGFITSLARRLSRFDWSSVDHDVLKVLYESVIKPEVRKSLGEYYTPDWLANRVVQEVVTDPLAQRVLDPSCGSGTFIFYAVRRFLQAADDAGLSLTESMARASSQVIGIDLHPVAVSLARVTYLLALGRERLASPERGTLSVPIYLGDSLGWDQAEDILSVDMLIIPTETGDQLFSAPLRFPDHLLDDAARFDDLVEQLVDEAGRAAGTAVNSLSAGAVRRLALSAADLPMMNENFGRLKQLHQDNRNHVWSYYVRNVSRPAWLSREENRVDVLIGNPPWLSYRHMTRSMQGEFRTMARARGFWHRENTATNQDLAGLFVARAVERYLKSGGAMGFVVPNSVVDRDYWAGFRKGRFIGAGVRFGVPWDLRRVRPHMFPRGSAVIFGSRSAESQEMPAEAIVWKGRVPRREAVLDQAVGITQSKEPIRIGSAGDELSPYHSRFSQGANLVPRLMFRVEETSSSALGVAKGMTPVQSKRSVSEKKPWKELPNLVGTVESQFVWPTVLGEHILQFRLLETDRFLLPLASKGSLISTDGDRIDAYPGLANWMRTAEALWKQHGDSRMSLDEQIDHMKKLTQQVPVALTRVAYAASGMHLAATLITDSRAVIEHGAYWAAVASEAEGHYLVGILNTPTLTELVRPLMSYGKDERHIDKNVWKLPIPAYDPADDRHQEISQLAMTISSELADREFASQYFVTMRQDIRNWLASTESGVKLEALVRELLGEPPADEKVLAVSAAEPALIRITSEKLNLEPADVEIDVDIEFDSAHAVYLWGLLVTHADGTDEYLSSGSAAVDLDEHALATSMLETLRGLLDKAQASGQAVRIYHYGFVEPIHLTRLLGEQAAPILAISTDLLQVVRRHFFSGIGYGLKPLAKLAGFTWRDAGMTGADTLPLIAAARSGDADAWDTLLRYNRDDVRATRALRRYLQGGGGPSNGVGDGAS